MKAFRIGGDIWQLERAQWRDRGWLRRVQGAKAAALGEHAYRTVPFYRARLDDAGIAPGDIGSADDLARLPITTPAELQVRAGRRPDQLALPSGPTHGQAHQRSGRAWAPGSESEVSLDPRSPGKSSRLAPPRFARGARPSPLAIVANHPSCPIDPPARSSTAPRLMRRAERRTRPSHRVGRGSGKRSARSRSERRSSGRARAPLGDVGACFGSGSVGAAAALGGSPKALSAPLHRPR